MLRNKVLDNLHCNNYVAYIPVTLILEKRTLQQLYDKMQSMKDTYNEAQIML